MTTAARVVLVGIDEYQGGPGWSLIGPVDDAIRFAEFFVARGVPPAQVTLLASPVPDASSRPAGVECRAADRATVREVFVRSAGWQETTLYVVWGGHGYVDLDRRRRLLYPDATAEDPVDLDLDSMLRRYNTSEVPALNRQVWLVDVCQVQVHDGLPRVSGHETFAAGDPVPGRAQDVYLAAGLGQPAVNLNRQRTGLFSREVLRLLDAGGLALLTDAKRLTDALQDRFTELRAGGSLEQTPTYLWHRDALGNEGHVLRRPGPAVAPAVATSPPPAALMPVVDALVEIPEFRRPNDREEILSLLRGAVYGSIRRNPATRIDAVAVLRACLRHPGGLPELVEAVRFFASDDEAVARFEEAAAQLRT